MAAPLSTTTSSGDVRGAPRRRRDLSSQFRRFVRNPEHAGYLFIAPWFIGVLLFAAYPLITTFYYSFTSFDLFTDPEWVGITNYARILTKDKVFLQVSWNTLVYVACSTVITIGLGLLFAVLLAQRFPGNYLFRTIVYVPTLLVGVATGILFKQIFATGDIGLVDAMLRFFHLGAVNWLSDFDNPWHAVVAMMMVNLWFTGGTMLIFLAGLKGISPSYYEAAQLDGAGPLRVFRSVTLPLLSPVIVLNTIMTLIGHIQVFDTPLTFAAGGGGGLGNTNVLGYKDSLGTWLVYIYQEAFIENRFGYASALAVIVFIITLILTLAVLWASNRFTYYGDVNKNG